MKPYGARRCRLYDDLPKACATRGRREARCQIEEGLAEIEADRIEQKRIDALFDEDRRMLEESDRHYHEYQDSLEPLYYLYDEHPDREYDYSYAKTHLDDDHFSSYDIWEGWYD